MIAVALKGLAGRKVRALLTAFAIVIGVSMVSGTFILTDTMQKTFDGLFETSYAKTDAVIEGKEVLENTQSNVSAPASLLEEVRALPQVEAAGGTVAPAEYNPADILGSDGKAVAKESLGVSYDPANARFSPLRLKTGAWPEGSKQIVVDAGTAEKEKYELGESITVSTVTGKHEFRVTGTASFGDVDSLGFGSIAVWDIETAQAVMNREGRFDSISIAARAGTSPDELVAAVKPLLSENLAVRDSEEQAKADSAEVNESMAYMRYFLLGFGAIALLVGAFVIFNTLSITVAQRTREFATLRTLGASRKQVMRSVKLEGLVIGLLASVIGLAFGIGIAKGMVALFAVLGLELPEATMVIALRTVVVSLLVGTVVTLIASVLPARRATRVPPIAAVREGSTLPRTRMASQSGNAGIAVTVASVAALSAGMFLSGVSGLAVGLLMAGGVLGLFAGIALLAPRLVKPLARIVGWPARRVGGVAGDLAGANSVRNPGRTASTAAALMIGLTLVTLVAVLGAGLRDSAQSAVAEQLHAGYVVSGEQGLPFRGAEGDTLAATAGVKSASHVRLGDVKLMGEQTTITAVDPASIEKFYDFAWTKGSSSGTLAELGNQGALVTKDFAEKEDLRIGNQLTITTGTGAQENLYVGGIYDPPAAGSLLGDVTMTQQGFDATFTDARNKFTFLEAGSDAQRGLEAAAKGFGDAELHTGAAYAEDSTKDMATVLAMLYVLLGFSVIVSLFGMVNTLVLSVFERTRELGMLRAIGMTRRQARRMIRHESIITALIGAALGLGLGIFLAALATQALSDYGIGFVLPTMTLVAFTLAAILAGVGAAIMPARRASRLNVLEALHYE
jgi:putative ABC transport system permease protein